jgi:hypothetical protein
MCGGGKDYRNEKGEKPSHLQFLSVNSAMPVTVEFP